MNCKHFSKCGSCNLYNITYKEALRYKEKSLKKLLSKFYSGEFDIFNSPLSAHRARAEFKIWHKGDRCYYAMTNLDKNGVELLDECPKVIEPIQRVYLKLLESINSSNRLKGKLFSIEFLAGLSGEVLVTLIYHKKLDEIWEAEALKLQEELNISVIGRSRKQKVVLGRDYIVEKLNINNKEYSYKYFEGGFTQPNPYINKNMIEWAIGNVKENGGDFLEAYCGLGNFTLPLSQYFNKVLATEISSTSIKAAKENCKLNGIENIEFIRLNAQETAEALKREREFRRLRDIDLNSYNFSTILVDPPRAGLDEASLELVKSFDNILYISCNPDTLARDLEELTKTHKAEKAALFDQFPYTHHIESGVYLKRKIVGA